LVLRTGAVHSESVAQAAESMTVVQLELSALVVDRSE
jgi:hypothetical protein